MDVAIGPEAIAEAAGRLAPWAHRTPVVTSRTLDERCGASVFLKCENLQRVGAFKFRGAMNAVLQLGEADRRSGVVTHSSGNHAQALALAGRLAGVPVCVVMPRTAPAVKRAATEGYGARVVTCEPTLADREATVERLMASDGYALVHPFDDWRVIAGQGTAARELFEQAGPLDILMAPVGGGGLLAGSALAAEADGRGCRVVGAEPLAADDAKRSLESGVIQPSPDPKTVADGLRTALGQRPFSVLRRLGIGVVTATEAEILDATRFAFERLKLVVEPSAAVPLAALMAGRLGPEARGRRIGLIISGGNVEVEALFRDLAAKWL